MSSASDVWVFVARHSRSRNDKDEFIGAQISRSLGESAPGTAQPSVDDAVSVLVFCQRCFSKAEPHSLQVRDDGWLVLSGQPCDVSRLACFSLKTAPADSRDKPDERTSTRRCGFPRGRDRRIQLFAVSLQQRQAPDTRRTSASSLFDNSTFACTFINEIGADMASVAGPRRVVWSHSRGQSYPVNLLV